MAEEKKDTQVPDERTLTPEETSLFIAIVTGDVPDGLKTVGDVVNQMDRQAKEDKTDEELRTDDL